MLEAKKILVGSDVGSIRVFGIVVEGGSSGSTKGGGELAYLKQKNCIIEPWRDD